MTDQLHFEFDAPILKWNFDDRLMQHYVELPDDAAAAFKDAGVKRVIATMQGIPFRRAIQTRKGGDMPFITVSRPVQKEIRAKEGDTIAVILTVDPNPESIDLPEEFEIVLDQDPEAKARRDTFTTGQKRGYAHYLSSAKREETRIKRAVEFAHKMKTYTLHGDLEKRNK